MIRRRQRLRWDDTATFTYESYTGDTRVTSWLLVRYPPWINQKILQSFVIRFPEE